MFQQYLRVAILYAALTLLLFIPVLPHLTVAIPGGPVAAIDGWQQVWNLWWFERAVTNIQPPLFTPLIFHPQGATLAIHPFTASNGLLVLPITSLFGPIAAYNAATYASFVLAGVAAYALAVHIGASPGAAAIAAAIFALSPYHTAKMFDGQLELVAIQWLGFFALFLLRVLLRWSTVDTLIAGLFLAVIGYTSLYYLLYSALLALLMVALWMPWRAGFYGIAQRLVLLSGIPCIALLCLLPLFLPILADLPAIAASTSGDRIEADFLILRSANLVDFFLPSALHPVWGSAADSIGAALHPGIAARNIALGYTTLALAGIGAVSAWQRSWRWLLIVVAALVLALGPQLQVGTRDTGLALPYRLLLDIPGMNITRRPSHFVVLATLALVPAAALGIQALQQRFRRPQLLLVIVTVLLVIEYLPAPLPVQHYQVHPVYAELRNRPGALLIVPEISKGSLSLQRQLTHERPIVGGFLARTPHYPFTEETPGVRQLWALHPERHEVGEASGTLAPLALRAYGISEIVVEWNDLTPGERSDVAAALAQVLPGVVPHSDDGIVSVYTVPEVSLRPFVYFGSGWHRAETDGARNWRWMGNSADLVLVNPLAEPQPVTLYLAGDSYLMPRAVTLTLNGAPVTIWDLNAAQGRGFIELRLLLAPGEQHLTLQAPASPENGGDGRGDLSILLETLQLTP
ncbi:hypothetical protein HC891_01070 [Candidatus Gracilibacteria bacterium]|nr:hypothetical protein [Candidatus Gracilibacteria bacterium]